MAKVSKVNAWIRFPELPLDYFREDVIFKIASLVGEPLKVDTVTAMRTRGNFARVCVELNLEKPLVSKLIVNGYHQHVEYEGLFTICFVCGRFGHKEGECGKKGEADGEKQTKQQEEAGGKRVQDDGETAREKHEFGPWMLAPRRRRSLGARKAETDGRSGANRFEALNNSAEEMIAVTNLTVGQGEEDFSVQKENVNPNKSVLSEGLKGRKARGKKGQQENLVGEDSISARPTQVGPSMERFIAKATKGEYKGPISRTRMDWAHEPGHLSWDEFDKTEFINASEAWEKALKESKKEELKRRALEAMGEKEIDGVSERNGQAEDWLLADEPEEDMEVEGSC